MRPYRLHLLAAVFLATPTLEALADTCERLDVTISGDLSSATDVLHPSDLAATEVERPTVLIPLEAIGAEDARIAVRLSRTEELIWVVELMSTNNRYPTSDKHFQHSGLRIDFDKEGNQIAPQVLATDPLTTKSGLPPQKVVVRFAGLRIVDDADDAAIVSAITTTEKCVPDAVDVTQVVNKGAAPVVRYYPPGEGERAMLRDRASE